jgi:hypothetical protein
VKKNNMKLDRANVFVLTRVARHVTSTWGQKVQKKLYGELLDRLDKIQSGISSVIRYPR